uniref:Uncharacterized protein n=1 Tax=Opuntia streptacantha TaxID=393608 RepID=A0A7C9DZ61_OPUST
MLFVACFRKDGLVVIYSIILKCTRVPTIHIKLKNQFRFQSRTRELRRKHDPLSTRIESFKSFAKCFSAAAFRAYISAMPILLISMRHVHCLSEVTKKNPVHRLCIYSCCKLLLADNVPFCFWRYIYVSVFAQPSCWK